MKLYTKTGDDGSTGLYGADRVSKAHPRVEAYGTVDECNSVIGMARAYLSERHNTESPLPIDEDLGYLQNALFDLGADLATRPGSSYEKNVSRMDETDVQYLENMIDRYQAAVPELRQFIHPGGTPAAAALQMARAVARRAERDVVRLSETEAVGDATRKYLNRLSDLLFVMARAVNAAAGESEELWVVSKRR